MIQRIQTLWLAIAIITAFLTMKQPLTVLTIDNRIAYTVDYNGIMKESSGDKPVTEMGLFAVRLILSAFVVISFVAVLLYKRRRIQKMLTLALALIAFALLLITLYHTWNLASKYDLQYKFRADDLLLLTLIVTPLLARWGISRDEELVRSYDRLR